MLGYYVSKNHYLPCFPLLCALFATVLLSLSPALAASSPPRITMYPVPAEVSSNHFQVSLNGRRTDVMHAATGYYLLNFDTSGPVTVTVTASDAHYWDGGVEVRPMRLGIRPVRHGASITFPLLGPQKLTIERPGDHFADAEILFLFANPPDTSGITAGSPNIRYYGPGVHRENIDARSGDTIYLAGGAVIFGSLNIWKVQNVHVLGEGAIIYDGPQNPYSDEGWMQKPNWHVIFMKEAHNIEIDGITCITRSRSWQVQMRDSRHIGFYNIKVIGGNPNNANQDGMDWLGGGDTTVRNSFFRASDDDFALQGNWDGYDLAVMRVPGHDVSNITIEDSMVSTSISNTVRINWPEKTFNSSHFHMSDIDVLNTGFGACKVPFAFFELWADPNGKGFHSDYSFSNIRLEDWYSLYQIRQPLPQVRNILFSGIWAMDSPGMVPSVLKGDVAGVTLRDATEQGYDGAQARVEDGAAKPGIEPPPFDPGYTYTSGLLKSRQNIMFTAKAPTEAATQFEWLFGDGSRALGREVHHAFPDAAGTLLDNSGRFRVLLHITGNGGAQTWSSQSVVLEPDPRLNPAARSYTESDDAADTTTTVRTVHVPVDGGYTFTLLTSTDATLSIDDGPRVHAPNPQPQVCGASGDAVQPLRISAALTAGDHHICIRQKAGIENADHTSDAKHTPTLLWEGPALARQLVPDSPQ